ncbi:MULTISPECIES: hypothetical protein [Pseudomonas]|nr:MULTISPECIES: hypothetical protein [Pseudomonas]
MSPSPVLSLSNVRNQVSAAERQTRVTLAPPRKRHLQALGYKT